ncbi:TonB-dependent receptor [Methylosinus sp. H3A]|uniref:TonB-dependent receptor n=1 Tax=Methylosinus sp. H3A TaxID=2785786 RepID=UPI00289ACB96|nr:TonB-dependent receptor [Methylosinus sp. H3A]
MSLASILAGIAAGVPVGEALAQATAQQAAAPSQEGGATAVAVIEDVQVTSSEAAGEKLLEKVLTKTPRSGNVVSERALEEQQVDTFTDISRRVAGYRPNISTARQSRNSLRGVGVAAGGGTGSASETGYIVDNVYWNFAGFQWGDLIDLSSVELAMGPTGTAGGKNTNAGSVILHTQAPAFEPKTMVKSTFGNYNHFKQTINTTGPLIEDALAYRFAAYLDRGDGWIKDPHTGTTYLDTNRLGLHFQLLGVGDGWSDRVSFIYNASNEHNDYLTGTIGDTSLVYANGTLPSATFFQNVIKKLGKPIWTIDPNTPYLSRGGRDPAHIFMLSNELNYQIGENMLTAITAVGYGSFVNWGYSDNQLLQLGLGSGSMDTYVLQNSQELRLSSPKEQEFEWTTGLYGFYEYAWDRMHHYDYGVDTAAWLGNPAALPGLTPWWLNKSGDFQIAAYAQGTYHVDEKFSLTFGLRDSYEIRYSSNKFRPNYYFGVPYTVWQQEAAIVAGGGYGWSDSGGETKYHNGVTAIVNPQYQVNDNILVYGVVGRGDKPQSVNTQNRPFYINGAAQSFTQGFSRPEVSWDYELGAKTNWFDGALISNVNLYWNDLYDFQITQTKTYTSSAGVTTNVSYLGNAPHVRVRGIEFVERWTPFEGLTLNASGAYNEVRYVDYKESPSPTDWTFKGGPSTISLSNTRVTGLPWWQVNGGFNYEHRLGNILAGLGDWSDRPITGFVYSNASWFNKAQYTNPRSLVQYWQPAYVMLDAGLGLRTEDRKYSLTLWSKNLFNNRPWSSWTPGTSSAPTTVGISTQGPRTFGVTSSITF